MSCGVRIKLHTISAALTRDIARQPWFLILFVTLAIAAGFAAVGEFHYVHHAPDGGRLLVCGGDGSVHVIVPGNGSFVGCCLRYSRYWASGTLK